MKFLGLVGVLFYWLTLVVIFKKWGVLQHSTVSDHVIAGSSKKLYTPVTLISIALFYLFLVGYFISEFDLGAAGYIFSTVALLSQMVAIFIVRKEPYVLLHDCAATVTGLTAFLLLLLVLLSDGASNMSKIIVASSLALMSVAGSILLNRNKSNYLYYQIFFYSCFHLAILVTTFQ